MIHELDVLGIGNAIVDVIAQADESVLHAQNIVKGGMMLIDEQRAAQLYDIMGPATMISGGSAANTLVGIASFGGKAGYIGKVKSDDLGKHFAHDIKASQVQYLTKPATDGSATACCYIFVTPDGERTMNTYLGASQNLSAEDIDEAVVASAKVTYLEGYLWDPAEAKKAFRKAANIAHAKGRQVALTLSDSFCVDRYRDEFLELMKSGTLDLVFANESELHALYQTSDFTTAVEALRQDVKLGVVTRGDQGCVIVSPKEVTAVPASRIETLVDTTGAGDLFAAGFLHGYTQDLEYKACAHLGGLAAAHIIQKVGARPSMNLKDLL